MPYAASHACHSDARCGLVSVARDLKTQLGGAIPDLAFLFISRDQAEQFDEIAAAAVEAIGCRCLLGCTGETIVAAGEELENGPAISVWCGVLPAAELTPFHVQFERTPDGVVCTGLPANPGGGRESSTMFLFGDPWSCAVDALLDHLADELPGVQLLGGMASGGTAPGENLLYLNRERVPNGGVGVLLTGGPHIGSVVSQGCRPLGETYVVTKANQNVIHELGGKPALVRFEELFATLNGRDRNLVQRGLHLGIVMNEYQARFGRGDFLIANVMGADRDSGAIAIGNLVRTGQTVQFHIRDAETADEDLRYLLGGYLADRAAPPQSALLFSCNGRGTRLFAEPNHDAGVVQELCGPLPLAGFFAQGELGPVGGKNHIHGFTASLALFDGD